ncbi:MAG TPA: DsrE family protein [Methylomirabilota bacterium]|nr:DsrE family protein [Methylomirabilota bacterium]
MDGVSNLRSKKLGILLSTEPGHPNLETCLGLSRAALAGGADLYLYLVDDAVANIDDDRVLDLGRRGAKLFVCAYGCQRRRLPITDKATYCGLVVLTDLINGCDRFLALN